MNGKIESNQQMYSQALSAAGFATCGLIFVNGWMRVANVFNNIFHTPLEISSENKNILTRKFVELRYDPLAKFGLRAGTHYIIGIMQGVIGYATFLFSGYMLSTLRK